MSESRLDTDSNLQRLSDSGDWDVADNEPDIRGWTVALSDGTAIGEVDDLMFDTTAMKARYIDVELDRAALALDETRHAMVPVERADIDTESKRVMLRGMDRDAVLHLQGGDVNHARTWHESAPSAPASTTRLTRAAEELRVGKRMTQAGEVRVGKHVETDHVTQNVERARERVTIERRPAGPGASTSPQFSDEEIVVPVMEEELVVEKRPVVKEELVIAKERVTEQQEVTADLRREEFDIKGRTEEVVTGRESGSGTSGKGER
jgi:uncharacterized protein (TIGR02271 family)